MNEIICDSGSLISLTNGCLDNLIYFFSEKFKLKFVIPPSVEYETVTRPLTGDLRKYLFSAVRIKDAIDDGVIIRSEGDLTAEKNQIMKAANSLFFIRGKPLRLIHEGESEMFALAVQLGVTDILIDERTARMLVEAPLKLKAHLEHEFKVNVMTNKNNLSVLDAKLKQFSAIRSSELVMLAYEKGYFDSFQTIEREALEAALYKIKFSGCSISFDEINAYLGSIKQRN